MADFSTLIATLQATIKTNYRQEITGQILQDDLLAIVDAVNRLKQDTLEGYAFHGAPLANGARVSVTQNTFFLVAEGEYTINGSTIEVDAAGVSVIVYDSVNNTTNWYTLFAYDTTPTENSRNAITSGAVAAALAPLATKEDVEAVEQEVAQIAGEAGLAEAVIDTDGVGTEQEFTFRKSGGDGGAYYRKIKGKTLAWNQLCPDGEEQRQITNSSVGPYSVNIINGHKYLVRFILNLSTRTSGYLSNDLFKLIYGVRFEQFGDASIGTNSINYIFTAEENASAARIALNYVSSDSENTGNVSKFGVIDLTLAGIADEISTAADFVALYPNIDPYNPGTLISNDAEAVETTGRNQYNPATGKAQVIGGQTYYIGGTYTSLSQDGTAITPAADGTFTPASTGEVEVVGGNATDTIINISDADNGLWQPYWKRTLQLGLTTKEDTDGNVPFADGMKGAGTASDWADKVGGEKRMGRVDLGSLIWTNSGSIFLSSSLNSLMKMPASNDAPPANGICNKYGEIGTYNESYNRDKAIYTTWIGAPAGTGLRVNDSAYTDAATFKAAMQGVMLDVELAAPVPFTWAEPLNLGVKVDENGTERAVAPEGATAPSAPFVADTTYTMSVARMVEKLRNL